MDKKTKELPKPEKKKLFLFALFAALFILFLINGEKQVMEYGLFWIILVPMIAILFWPYAFIT